MRQNVAGQKVNAFLADLTDGSAVTTGTTTVYVTGDGGTQTSGSGTVSHKGNGQWEYTPTQAETNFGHIAFLFTNSAAISACVNVFTTEPQTGDVADVEVDTQDIQSRLPAALVGGRMDADVGNIQNGSIVAASFGAGAVDAAALSTDAVNEIADQVLLEQVSDHSGTAGSLAARLDAIDTVATKQSKAVIGGSVTTAQAPSTTAVSTDLSGYAADSLINRLITFDTDGTGEPGFQAVITDYAATNGVITWDPAAPSAPADGDGFTIT